MRVNVPRGFWPWCSKIENNLQVDSPVGCSQKIRHAALSILASVTLPELSYACARSNGADTKVQLTLYRETMARTPPLNLQSPDITAIDLNRVLSRLEHKILSSPDPRLQYSSYERTKTSAVCTITASIRPHPTNPQFPEPRICPHSPPAPRASLIH